MSLSFWHQGWKLSVSSLLFISVSSVRPEFIDLGSWACFHCSRSLFHCCSNCWVLCFWQWVLQDRSPDPRRVPRSVGTCSDLYGWNLHSCNSAPENSALCWTIRPLLLKGFIKGQGNLCKLWSEFFDESNSSGYDCYWFLPKWYLNTL